MAYRKFIENNKDSLEVLGNILKIRGLDIEMAHSRKWGNDRLPHISNSSSSFGLGIYVRIDKNTYLNENEYHSIRGIFPVQVYEYEVRLHNISDYDDDDDRSWKPSISFSFYKNDVNQLDQPFLTTLGSVKNKLWKAL
tara:strand:- start:1737 stop:2150 length:414 start_codon:yes stop_codon:yes gene_type:complete